MAIQIGCQFRNPSREQLIYLDMFLRYYLDQDASGEDRAGGDHEAPSDEIDADPFAR